jgi:hypothetical protein
MSKIEKISGLDNLFDRSIAATQRAAQERHGPQYQLHEWHGPRFQGRPVPVNTWLDAVAWRDARVAELNRPVSVAGVLAGIVEAVVDAVAAVVPGKPRERAVQFLRNVLANGAIVPSLRIERLAKEAGISGRTLRRAKKVVGVKHVRNADLSWSWMLNGQKAAAR